MDDQRGSQGGERQGEDGDEGGGGGEGNRGREDTPPAPCSAFCGPRSCATLPPSLSAQPQQGTPAASPGRGGGSGSGGGDGAQVTSEPSKRRRLWGLRGLVKMFRRRVRRRTGENTSPPPPQPTLRARSTSELAMDIQHSRSGGPYNQGLSVSHDSVFTPDGAEHHHHHAHATPPSLTIATRGVNMAELKAALRQRRGDDSGSGDDDPGLPRSPPTSPTTLDVLTHGLKGSSRATQSSCSDGSLLSMGSSENDEDSLGAASHHSSRASLLEGRHQVVDHEPVAGAVRLSHQAALHKIAVRPRRTHGAPRSRRATQIGGQISLPDVIEEANSRHPSGPRPSSTPHQPAAAATTPAPAPPTPVPSTQVTPEDDVSMEESPAVREPQNSPDTATPERKEERREDQPLFQRLFGSTSKRAGRRHSRGSGEESRENSVSPLRRGTEQRASKDRRHETSSPRFLIGSSKPRQDGHALPPSGRPRDPSKERGSREVPQSPEDVQGGGVAASAWPQGVRKAKSFREEQAPVHREALRRKVSSHAAADEQNITPTKASRLSSSLESIDGDDTRKPTQRSTPTATPPTVTTASPQRSSTESLTTTPLPGVFIRPYPQAGHPRGQPHPSPADTSSGPFSLDSSLNQQPREVEDQMRKASSVDQMTVTETTTTTHHREHHTRETLAKEQVTKEQLAKEHAAREHIIEQHIKEQHMKEQLNKDQHIREEHIKQTTTTTTTTTTKTCEAKQAAMAAAKQSLLDTLVESIKPDRKTETPKATPRRSLSQTQPQVLPKEEPPPGTPQQEPEGEQTPPRRPLRREASVKRLPAPMSDSESVAVPEFMRIQLNRVESKGQSVIYDTEQEKGGRKEEEDVPRKDTGSMDIPKDTPTEPDLNALKKDVAVKDAPTSAAAKDVTRKTSMQGSRPLLKDTRDASPSGVLDGEGNTETPEQERVQLRRPVVTDRTPTAERSVAAATTPTTSRDQPELFKVFARRSFKIKDSDKELFETSIEDTGVEASSEVSEMVVSSVRPSSTSPRPPVNTTPATDAQKIGINAISYNRKSVGNPALSFMPPPLSSANEQVNRPQTTTTTSKTPPTTASTTKSPQTTASTSKSPQPSTDSSTTPPTVYSKILSNRMSGSEVSSGNESEGSVSSPVPIRAPATQQTKPAMAARPGSAIIWPPRPQASQEDTAPPQPTTAPQDTPHRKSLGSVDTKEASQDGIEVEVSPLDISAARRRFMSASYPPDRPGTSPALGTSPPALTPSPVTPSPSPPAPTPSPPAPTHPPISSNILSRVGSIGTTNPATPSFTVTVRTQPPAETPAPSTAPSAPPTGGSPGEQGKGDAGQGQQTAEDWRVLVRQRREGRLKHTKTPDSEEIIIETRPPVSRNSKVLEMASNFQKLQVA